MRVYLCIYLFIYLCILSFSKSVQTRSGDKPVSHAKMQVSVSGVKQLDREVDHSPIFGDMDSDEGNYISTSPKRLHVVGRDGFTFIYDFVKGGFSS
jgi:hypothetical protein